MPERWEKCLWQRPTCLLVFVGRRQKSNQCNKHSCSSFSGHSGFRPGSSVASPVYTNGVNRSKAAMVWNRTTGVFVASISWFVSFLFFFFFLLKAAFPVDNYSLSLHYNESVILSQPKVLNRHPSQITNFRTLCRHTRTSHRRHEKLRQVCTWIRFAQRPLNIFWLTALVVV